jgi:hypothetical protein
VTNAVVAIVLFIAIIGGLTWYRQYAPRSADFKGGGSKLIERDVVPEVVRFIPPAQQRPPLHAVWELKKEDGSDAEHVLESEKGTKGEYYFLFQNMLEAPVEMEMVKAACDCTAADICIVPAEDWSRIKAEQTKKPWAKPALTSEPAWQQCQKNQHRGIQIPAQGHGILRIHWDGRKDPGSWLNLNLEFWSQPDHDPGNRQTTQIIVPVRVVYPLLYEPGRQDIGMLGPGEQATALFHVWSATRNRKQLDAAFGPRDKDALFEVESRPLTDKECADLQRHLQNKMVNDKPAPIDTRVLAGYLVKATVHEQAGNEQMDQGPFQRAVPARLDQVPAEIPTPVVSGHVRGPLDVGGDGDRARVQFKTFSAAETKSVTIPIYGNPAFKLELAEKDPPFLQVDFKHNDKESTSQRGRWDLKVTVPAGTWSGALPEHSRVVLRIVGERPRLVRIPVVGNATR